MAESFSNSVKRAVGIVSTVSSSATVGISTNRITGFTLNTGVVAVGDLVVNQHFRSGAKVTAVGSGGTNVDVDRYSTNTAEATSQSVSFLGVTTAYSSPAATKSVLIGGTFANLTENNINIYVEVLDESGTAGVSSIMLASDIPIPSGSSFVISEAGKTVLEATDKVLVYSDTASSVDVNLSILKGVS